MTDSNSISTPATPQRDYYQALYQAALTITSSLDLDQVLQSVVSSTTEAMGVKACALRLLDAASGQLRLSAVYGLSSEYLAKGPVNVTSSPVDNEALHGSPVYIADVRTDPRFQYKDAARHEGLVSILCVPLEVRGEAIGVMRVYTNTVTTFHEDDIQFLSVLASLAALAIENARLYESVKNSYNGVMSAFWGTYIEA
ncbi:MAG TPA: GAF domain-containing protein [Ktedonobacteraceae bacterium]|nr:GAF domain-containing protein [Ktedonobacteraceae bacterium]